MTFKIGDKVQIRNLTKEERQTIPLFYHDNMKQYEGKTGKLIMQKNITKNGKTILIWK